MPRNKYKVGDRFTFLTAVRKTDGRKHHEVVWECLCDCGNITEVITGNLKRTKSCGKCDLARPLIEEDERCINSLFAIYKRGAVIRNLDFKLSKQEFIDLLGSDCYYCHLEPSNKHILVRKKSETELCYTYSGIDRVDNRVGYFLDNCVPCCRECNIKKSDIDPDMVSKIYFLLWDDNSPLRN